MPEFFWILSANFSDAMQPWSNSLLDHVARNNSTFHVEHTSCAYFFPSNVILARSHMLFYICYCFPKWINRRSNRTYNYNDEFIRLLFWTISQLCYLQKKKKNCQISEFDKFFLFLITVNPPLFPKLRISWRDPGIFIINFLININSYVWSSFIKYY